MFKNKITISNRNLFWVSFLLILISEACSFIAFNEQHISQWIFLVGTLLGAAILSFINIEYLLYIIFAELFVSSFGHLFFVNVGPAFISLRIGLFLLINGIFFLYTLKNKDFEFKKSVYFWPNTLFFIAIVIGFIIAFWRGNSPTDIFDDANGYIAFAYLIPAITILKTSDSKERLFTIFKASILWLFAQTAVILFIFSHRLLPVMRPLYLWIRDARIGEITQISGDFYRIFFQSYNFALISAFVFGAALLINNKNNEKEILKNKNFLYFIASVFLILESFSRSFWFGGTIATLIIIGVLVVSKINFKKIIITFGQLFFGAIISLVIIVGIVNFPLPPKGAPISLTNLFGNRALSLFDDAAAGSRWNLLPVLTEEIKKAPILGAGFGKNITYKTEDPRLLAEKENGMQTTFAFEWGYLDMWLKLGLFGLVIYGWFIGCILKKGWHWIKDTNSWNDNKYQFGLWLGIIALLAANVFTPYLNHPLGIGSLVMAAVFFEKEKFNK